MKKFINLGSHEILSKEYGEAEQTVKEILKDYFRPEFLNRVDDIVVFKLYYEHNKLLMVLHSKIKKSMQADLMALKEKLNNGIEETDEN